MQGKTILVPLDGSATAEAALSWADALARALKLPMLLLTVIQGAGLRSEQEEAAAARAAQHYLTGVAASLQHVGVNQDVRTVQSGEDVQDVIVTAARESDAALIVIATHGYSGFDRWMMGSVADGVLRTADRPLLVVRADPALQTPEPRRFERIIVPLDGFGLAETALPAATDLARACGAVLDLVHVVPSPWAFVAARFPSLEDQVIETAIVYLERLAATMPKEIKVEYHVRQGSAASGILDYADEAGPSLVVMSTSGRGGVSRWALGSVADRVVRSSYRPVLLVRPTPEQVRNHALFDTEEEGRPKRRTAPSEVDVHPTPAEEARS